MNFADFLRMRQMGPHPVGAGAGDHRMDQVERERAVVYPMNPAPGMVCFEDGSCVPAEDLPYQGQQYNPNAQQAGGIGGVGHDGTAGPTVFTGGRSVTPQPTGRPPAMPGAGAQLLQMLLANTGGGRAVTPQPTGRPGSMPGTGDAFARFLMNRMAGQGTTPVAAFPSPSPSMDPRSVVCDENGQNCRPVYMR